MLKINSRDKFPLDNFNFKNTRMKNNELLLNEGLYNLKLNLSPEEFNEGDRFSIYINDTLFKTEKIPLLSTNDLKINYFLRLDSKINILSIKNSSDDFINLKNFQGGIFMATTNFLTQIINSKKIEITLPAGITFTTTAPNITFSNPAIASVSTAISGQPVATVNFASDLIFNESYQVTIDETSLSSGPSIVDNLIPAAQNSFISTTTVPYTDLAFDLKIADGFIIPLDTPNNLMYAKVERAAGAAGSGITAETFENVEINFFTDGFATVILKDNSKGKFTDGVYSITVNFVNDPNPNSNQLKKIENIAVTKSNYRKITTDDCLITSTGNRLVDIKFKGTVKNIGATSSTLVPGSTVFNNFYISYFGQDPVSKDANRNPLGFLNVNSFQSKVNDLGNKLSLQAKFNLPVPASRPDLNTSHHDMIVQNLRIGVPSAILKDTLDRALELTVLPFAPTESHVETKVVTIEALSHTKIKVKFTQPVCCFSAEKDALDGLVVTSVERIPFTLNELLYTLSDETPVNTDDTVKIFNKYITDAYGIKIAEASGDVTVPANPPTFDDAVQDSTSTKVTKVILTFNDAMDVVTTTNSNNYIIKDTSASAPISPAHYIISADPSDKKVFFVTFDYALPSGSYDITAKQAIKDKYGVNLAADTTKNLTITNYISPEITNVYVTDPAKYSTEADSMVIVFNQKMNYKAATVEDITAIDEVTNYALTAPNKDKVYLDDSLATVSTMYDNNWSNIQLSSLETLGDLSLTNPRINIGYTRGPQVKYVRSYYSNSLYPGNVYPICDSKFPTVLVDKYSIANDRLSMSSSNDLKLTHIISETDTNNFFNFIKNFTSNDFVVSYVSNGEKTIIPSATTIIAYDTIPNILNGAKQVITFDISPTLIDSLSSDDLLEVEVIDAPSSLDIFGKAILPGKISTKVGDVRPSRFHAAELTENPAAGIEFYKRIKISAKFTGILDTTQALDPSQFTVTSALANPGDFIMTESATILASDASIIELVVIIPRSNKCTDLQLELDGSTIFDAKGHLVEDFGPADVKKPSQS